MIFYNGRRTGDIHFGTKRLIAAHYLPFDESSTWKLVWQGIRSCFGSGVWRGNKPWIGKDAWKNK